MMPEMEEDEEDEEEEEEDYIGDVYATVDVSATVAGEVRRLVDIVAVMCAVDENGTLIEDLEALQGGCFEEEIAQEERARVRKLRQKDQHRSRLASAGGRHRSAGKALRQRPSAAAASPRRALPAQAATPQSSADDGLGSLLEPILLGRRYQEKTTNESNLQPQMDQPLGWFPHALAG